MLIKTEILEFELQNKAQFLRNTNRGGNIVYKFSSKEALELMKEVGFLREISFKNIGGGTGKELDIDEYDNWFDQLIVWSPKEKRIIGGYRIQRLSLLPFEWSPLHHFFQFSESFVEKYSHHAIELGRSFVIPEYQRSGKGVFALDNLFDAIAAWISQNPSVEYLVGKITMYPRDAFGNKKDLSVIYEAIDMYFKPKEILFTPRDEFYLNRYFPKSHKLKGDLKSDIRFLMREYDAPPLLSVYSNLASDMEAFGTIEHSDFGEAEETCIMLRLSSISEETRKNYHL